MLGRHNWPSNLSQEEINYRNLQLERARDNDIRLYSQPKEKDFLDYFNSDGSIKFEEESSNEIGPIERTMYLIFQDEDNERRIIRQPVKENNWVHPIKTGLFAALTGIVAGIRAVK